MLVASPVGPDFLTKIFLTKQRKMHHHYLGSGKQLVEDIGLEQVFPVLQVSCSVGAGG